jgi:hypothetical protein
MQDAPSAEKSFYECAKSAVMLYRTVNTSRVLDLAYQIQQLHHRINCFQGMV